MKYLCQRTSQWEGQPCAEATQERFVGIDRRTLPTPEAYDARFGPRDTWHSRGTNHRIEGGMIARDMDAVLLWVVEIPDLAALMAFIAKYGRVVIQPYDGYHGITHSLEIYDDYRE